MPRSLVLQRLDDDRERRMCEVFVEHLHSEAEATKLSWEV